MDIKHVQTKDGVFFKVEDELEITLENDYISSALTEFDNRPPEWLMNAFNRPQKHYIYFCNFGTNSLVRRKGYGRKLLQDVKKYYEGCIVYLAVGSCGEMSNAQLIEFYASEGFKLIEHNDYPYKGYPVMAIEL